MIADGKIVAWFQGRMEFGPPALSEALPRRTECVESRTFGSV